MATKKLLSEQTFTKYTFEQLFQLLGVKNHEEYDELLVPYVTDWSALHLQYHAYVNWYMATQTPLGKALS